MECNEHELTNINTNTTNKNILQNYGIKQNS